MMGMNWDEGDDYMADQRYDDAAFSERQATSKPVICAVCFAECFHSIRDRNHIWVCPNGHGRRKEWNEPVEIR